MIISLKQKKNFRFKPRMKLNHNIFTKTAVCFQEVDNCSTSGCGTIEMYNVLSHLFKVALTQYPVS